MKAVGAMGASIHLRRGAMSKTRTRFLRPSSDDEAPYSTMLAYKCFVRCAGCFAPDRPLPSAREQALSYFVIKTLKGRRYLYWQRSYRQGRRVRTASTYIGPADGGGRKPGALSKKRSGPFKRLGALIAANRTSPEERGYDRNQTKILEAIDTKDQKKANLMADLQARYGLKAGPDTPTPVEKPDPGIDLAAPAANPAAERLV